MARAKQFFLNFGYLTAGQLLGDVFTFLFFIGLSKAYGAEVLGHYSLAVAITGFVMVFVSYGLSDIGVRDLSRRVGRLENYPGLLLSVRIVLSIAFCTFFFLALPLLPFDEETKSVARIFCVYRVLFSLIEGFSAVYVAHEKTFPAALFELCCRFLVAMVGLLVIWSGGNLKMALLTFPLLTAAVMLIAWVITRRRFGNMRLNFAPVPIWELIKRATPFAVADFLRQAASRLDIIFVGIMVGTVAAGWYNAAYRVVFLLVFIPALASWTLLPQASQQFIKNPKEFSSIATRASTLLIMVALPSAGGIWLLAPDIIALIYSSEFLASIEILQWLALLLIFTSYNALLAALLNASDGQRYRAWSQWIGVLVNVVGNIILISLFGYIGAAWATLISEALIMALFFIKVRVWLDWPIIISRILISTIGTIGFLLIFVVYPNQPMALIIPGAVIVYIGVLSCFRTVRASEISLVIGLVSKRQGSGNGSVRRITSPVKED